MPTRHVTVFSHTIFYFARLMPAKYGAEYACSCPAHFLIRFMLFRLSANKLSFFFLFSGLYNLAPVAILDPPECSLFLRVVRLEKRLHAYQLPVWLVNAVFKINDYNACERHRPCSPKHTYRSKSASQPSV